MSASINSLQEGQNQTIQNVKTLQDTENGLYKQLGAMDASEWVPKLYGVIIWTCDEHSNIQSIKTGNDIERLFIC